MCREYLESTNWNLQEALQAHMDQMETEEANKKINMLENFQKMTDIADVEKCKSYMEASNWILQEAVQRAFQDLKQSISVNHGRKTSVKQIESYNEEYFKPQRQTSYTQRRETKCTVKILNDIEVYGDVRGPSSISRGFKNKSTKVFGEPFGRGLLAAAATDAKRTQSEGDRKLLSDEQNNSDMKTRLMNNSSFDLRKFPNQRVFDTNRNVLRKDASEGMDNAVGKEDNYRTNYSFSIPKQDFCAGRLYFANEQDFHNPSRNSLTTSQRSLPIKNASELEEISLRDVRLERSTRTMKQDSRVQECVKEFSIDDNTDVKYPVWRMYDDKRQRSKSINCQRQEDTVPKGSGFIRNNIPNQRSLHINPNNDDVRKKRDFNSNFSFPILKHNVSEGGLYFANEQDYYNPSTFSSKDFSTSLFEKSVSEPQEVPLRDVRLERISARNRNQNSSVQKCVREFSIDHDTSPKNPLWRVADDKPKHSKQINNQSQEVKFYEKDPLIPGAQDERSLLQEHTVPKSIEFIKDSEGLGAQSTMSRPLQSDPRRTFGEPFGRGLLIAKNTSDDVSVDQNSNLQLNSLHNKPESSEEFVLFDERFTCNVCYEEYNFDYMVQCADGHLFCILCLTSWAEESVYGQGKILLPCLDTECDTNFPESQLRRALPDKLKKIFDERALEESINTCKLDNFIRCPYCDFGAVIEDTQYFSCPNLECQKTSCRTCRKDWFIHKGLECNQIEEEKETTIRKTYEEKMAKAKIRQCSNCKASFTKETGCNKITCRCGTTMCYICRLPNIDYNHFCRHPRDPGHGCAVCNIRCTTYTDLERDEELAIQELKNNAAEARAEQGFTEFREIGAPRQ